MEQYYPTHLFLDLIESIQGIHLQADRTKQDVIVRFYVGLRGSVVMIDCSDEDLPYTICKDYCLQLGIEHVTGNLFDGA
jgi:hypothetical protein